MDQLTSDEWDVLIYVASYIAGYGSPPTRRQVVQAGLAQPTVERLLIQGFLDETDDRLRPVLQEGAQAELAKCSCGR